jgi:hypothetical protein
MTIVPWLLPLIFIMGSGPVQFKPEKVLERFTRVDAPKPFNRAEEAAAFLQPGDPLWVGWGMARGYNLPFGEKLTVAKVRLLFMHEARLRFEGIDRRIYLRTDFGPDYAFRTDPEKTYAFTPEQWQSIREGRITVGMSKEMFLCIKPKAREVHYQPNPAGPIEQWIYRDNPREMYGDRSQNPPTAIYYFQNDVLITIL